ncbi:zinc transport system permease protein [Geoalkalibacter ferrihydriticus]|uniref:High-affinity zinc uptake system membrane protein ZnuB n=2 Tax=Geoalkalibacter ferrihydriticus TaxID=392333 RepID=A0A0C2EA17_9BACT|nr:zinc ABC transporter permease subunit ZnuB [Geoalkalibacter ferrihydriticus]KIH75433.1 membrane protein [Geoalkalibacter ferrihydriticus DSM 17813]SDM93156.1 zinc transport system permease protein [Geoalkalibacter ferrihydriticus]
MIFDDFLLRALFGGLGVAAVSGPFGVFMVWRRLAYFGDTLAHSALLGIALGLLLNLDPTLAVIAVCQLLALLLFALQRQRELASDTLLGILSHGSLALGLVALAFMQDVRVDLMAYLFGDILAVNRTDLAWIFSGGLLAITALAAIWRPLLALTVHEDLARVDGVRVGFVQWLYTALLALVVAVMMKIVGVILVTALLIIPAATARRLTRTPETMAAAASLVGCLAVGGGLAASLQWDTPAGPSIVVAAALLFILSRAVPRRFSRA